MLTQLEVELLYPEASAEWRPFLSYDRFGVDDNNTLWAFHFYDRLDKFQVTDYWDGIKWVNIYAVIGVATGCVTVPARR